MVLFDVMDYLTVALALFEGIRRVDAPPEHVAVVLRRGWGCEEAQLEDREEVHRARPVPQQLPVRVLRWEVIVAPAQRVDPSHLSEETFE